MRFHQLLLENITSLRGTHVINFDSLNKTDDLFAITGPTGSGKSSILNAIIMALYGETPKSDLKQSDLVSLGEKKARIELLFSINGKKFRSIWEGKAKGSAPRRFFNESGEEISKDILPLTFEQFCKTIILNQGEFARFLTSSFAERKDILEKLYGEEILAKLSPCLSTIVRRRQEEVNQLIEQEKNILPYAQEEIDLWLEESEILDREIQKEKKTKDILNTFISDLKDILKYHQKDCDFFQKNISLSEELKNYTTAFNNDQSNVSNSESELLLFEQHISKIRPELLFLIEKEKEKELLLIQNEQKKKEQQLLNNKTEQAKKLLLELTSSIQERKNHIKTLGSRTSLPTAEYHDQRALFIKAQKIFSDLKTSQSLLFSKNEQHHKDLQKKEFLLSQELDATQSLKNLLESFLEPIPQKKQELETIKEENKSKLRLITELDQKLTELEKQKDEILNALKLFQNEKERLDQSEKGNHFEENIKNVFSKFEYFLKIQAKEQNCCPICFNQNITNIHVDKTKEQCWEDIIKNSFILQEKLVELHKKKAQIEEKASLAQKNFEVIDSEIDKTQKYLKINSATEYKTLILEIDTQIENLEILSRKKLIQEQKLSYLKEEINKLEHENLKQKNDLDILANKQAAEEFALQEIFRQAKTPVFFNQLEQSLTAWNDEINALGELKQNSALLLEQEKNLEQTKKQTDLLENEIKRGSIILDEIQNAITLIANTLNKSLPPGKNASQLLKQEEASLTEHRLKRDNFVTKLQKTIQNKQNIEIQLKSNNDQRHELNLLMTKLWFKFKDNLAKHQDLNIVSSEKILTPQTPSEIEDWNLLTIFLDQGLIHRLEEIDFSFQEKRQKLEENRAKIAIFDEKKEQQKTLKEEFKKRKHELSRWSNLHELIGNDEFRNFTLSLIEKELIIFANNELQNLCQGRFALEQTEVKKGNDFSVIDRWKGGELRKVSTLSGGETFLVSLALAMALAEMSRGTASVESFFIDEGFGTLDQESLTEVLEALSSLKGRGKVVGLISHIKELTDRIAVNIVVRKNVAGESRIEIAYN